MNLTNLSKQVGFLLGLGTYKFLSEASAQVKSIDEICGSAKRQLDEATDIAEGVLSLLGRR